MRKLLCCLLALLIFLPGLPAGAAGAEIRDTYTVPDDAPYTRLTDTDALTRITVNRGKSITITLSSPAKDSSLYLNLQYFS